MKWRTGTKTRSNIDTYSRVSPGRETTKNVSLCVGLALALLAGLLSATPTPAVAQSAECTTNVYSNSQEAKDNYEKDCGRPFENTPDFRCDWVNVPTSGFQCSGPGNSTNGNQTDPTMPEPGSPDCVDGAGGVYPTATKAKEEYRNDCGQTFENTPDFRCDWVNVPTSGFQCSGPVGDSPSEERVVVSMGDSYLSGESGHLIGNNRAETRDNAYESETDCRRSDGDLNNTAKATVDAACAALSTFESRRDCRRSDVAPINSANIPGVTAINIACAGAVTADIGKASQSRETAGRFGEGLQIHQLRDIADEFDVEMVVVSIGGNDFDFSGLATACAVRYLAGSNCETREGLRYEKRLKAISSDVEETLQEIRRLLRERGDGDARVVLQSYPSPVPATTDYDAVQRAAQGCAFKASDMRYISTSFIPLIDDVYRQAAQNARVEFLSLADAFDGKELCSPSVTSRNQSSDPAKLEWATGIRLSRFTNAGFVASPESLHPNALGQEALGKCLRLVWDSSAKTNSCYNNGGAPSNMRIGGRAPTDRVENGEVPDCVTAKADPDGDGWGWENDANCVVGVNPEDVDCQDASGNEGRLCEMIIDRINNELEVGRVSIDRNGFLFSYEDPSDIKVSKSSCSRRTEVTHQRATAQILSTSTLDLTGNGLTEPIGLHLEAPFRLSAQVNAKTELGTRNLFNGNCHDYATDHYNARASVSGVADVLIAFDLDPRFRTDANGDLLLNIAPKAHVAMDLRDPNLKFSVNGANPIVQLVSFLTGLSNLLIEAPLAGLSGDSFSDALESAAIDVGIPFAVTTGSIASMSIFSDLIEDAAERKAAQALQNVTPDLENDLNAEIAEALDLDANGRREFVIPADFAQLIQSGATLDELLLLAS